MPKVLKRDPTRTTLLRKWFMRDLGKRFREIAKLSTEILVDDDVLGYDVAELQFNIARQAWRFRTDAGKVTAYRNWLQEQVDAKILNPTDGITGKPWTAKYIDSAYRKGLVRSYTDVRKADLAESPDFYKGSRAEFLQQSFGASETLSKLEFINTRVFEELRGITDAMGQQLSRTLADGLARGDNPRIIAREISKRIQGITRQRANVLARTEIIHAHAEGQLDAFELLKIEGVQVLAEWSTAGDEIVCELCSDLEGVVMTIKEARGSLPRHPNCRCAWVPADRKIIEKGQKRGELKEEAIRESIQAERPKLPFGVARARSTWLGKTKLKAAKKTTKKAVPSVAKKPVPTKKPPSRAIEGPLNDWEAYYKKYEGVKPDKLIRYDYLKQLPKEKLTTKQVNFLSKMDEFYKEGIHSSRMPFRDIDEWVKKLSSHEYDALKSWKAGSYNLRKFQLGQISLEELNAKAAGLGTDVRWGGKHFANAIGRAPNYQGKVYRGTGFYDELENLKVGKKIQWNANYSTSKSEKVAKVFLEEGGENSYLFEIQAKTGVDISGVTEAYTNQKEVVTRIGSKYLVKGVEKIKEGMFTYKKVILEEIV